MKRRELLAGALGAAALSAAGQGARSVPAQSTAPAKGRFNLKYAPSFGQFKNNAGNDLTAQIQFAADEGFGAMFDNVSWEARGRAGYRQRLARRNSSRAVRSMPTSKGATRDKEGPGDALGGSGRGVRTSGSQLPWASSCQAL
jgi:hypothetical protein